ncbi:MULTISPECIES: prepilin-type N-terminal cleavage/methylation domain-containing protein [Caloramator]|uniref:Prepilin-type N-terminal cleavage/methylation domain-containing protein n=1 Tax=Caloramator proteoclasticus DSM 10124 TaxID=1121262 RepID=A0A1M4YA81_9CLOT|nr:MULTISPECIES: prepilin-type N-terminal cleavage/methylation domain-containing protein [Caloramator]SHF02549.1 prepilin-type N-terminal cleavage/methylation domain-containing protein [Caloramator proteoclasticus DSM 10124]
MKKKKGFTLIELIAAIAIIGILAATLIPEVTSYTVNAKNTKLRSEARMLLNAIELYNASVQGTTNGELNANTQISDLSIDANNPNATGLKNLIDKLTEKNSELLNYTINELKALVEEGTLKPVANQN